jgi:hypothetical protein
MQAMLTELAALVLATAVPGPGKVTADPAPLVAGVIFSNHVDAASLDRAAVMRAAGAGEPWRAAPGVFFADGGEGGAGPDAAARVERLEGGWLWIRVCSLGGGAAMEVIQVELEKASGPGATRGVILDLRALEDYREFEGGARLAGLFVPEGCTLFSLEGRGEPQVFAAREPARMPIPPLAVIVNSETRGVGEAMAAALRSLRRAVIFGSPTAGRSAEYGAAELPSGRRLWVPSRRVALVGGGQTFHEPVKPDIEIDGGEIEAEMLRREAAEGPGDFIAEDKPRPRQNEAALVRGENPELEEAIQKRLEESSREGVAEAMEEEPIESEGAAPLDVDGVSPEKKGDAEAGDKPARDEALQRALDFLRALDALGLNRVEAPDAAAGATNAPPAGGVGSATQ